MATQRRETGKNYIGLLSDETEELRAVDAKAATAHSVKHYVLGLTAAMFNRRSEAAVTTSEVATSEVVTVAPSRR